MDKEISTPADIEIWYANEVIKVTKEHWDQYREKIINIKKEKQFLYEIITGVEKPNNIKVKYEYKGS